MSLRALGLAGLLTLSTGMAAAEPFAFDKSHTQIYFSVDHLGFSTTHGLFREFDGTIELDAQRPEASRVDFVIQSASVDTQFEPRDKHIRSKDFLNAERFPTMRFASERVERTGEGTARVHGSFTLLGVTKPMVLKVTLNKLGVNPASKKQTAGFTVEAVVKRTDFGMSTYAPAIGDEVRVRIDAEAAAS